MKMKKLAVLLAAAMLMVSCASMEDKVQQMNEEVTAQRNDPGTRNKAA